MDNDLMVGVMNAYTKGREKERDLVVDYLRKRAASMSASVVRDATYALAEEIEEQEHFANGEQSD